MGWDVFAYWICFISGLGYAVVAAILGGRGSVLGAGLAGFLLGFLEIFVAWVFPSTMRDLISFGIILIILTFRPHGFFGEPYSAQLRL